MRAIMQGLTDAEFERLYGTEEQWEIALDRLIRYLDEMG